MKVGRVTLSDRASVGIYPDLSGPEIERVVSAWLDGPVEWRRELLPDSREEIERALCRLADEERCHLILTTGGTGPAPRDVTPEATRAVLEKELPGTRVLCVHRTGALGIGEMAVWIGASSAHRPAAFAACREAIEELKRQLPVWKKEHYTDDAAGWVDCTAEQNPAARRAEYFDRVARLPEVWAAGLGRLAAARVLVVGAGGLGSAVLEGLADSGVGFIRIVDHGLVERSNLPRQTLYTEGELGLPKAAVHGFEGTVDIFRPGQPEPPVFTPAVAMLGQLQAAEAAKLLLELPVPSAAGATLLFDFLQCCLTRIARPSV